MARGALRALLVLGVCAAAAAGLRVSKEEQAAEEFMMDEDVFELQRVLSDGLPPQLNASRLRALADIQSGRPGSPEEEGGYDCEKLPHMCQAPFHCDQWTRQDTLDVRRHGLATSDGHPNLRSWCMPGLERYASTVVKECVVNKNLRTGGAVKLSQDSSDWAEELEASYCFAEGHCTNEVASENTTMADMEGMCDDRFGGRKGWTRNFVKSLNRLTETPRSVANLASAKPGTSTQRITRVMAKMACAQGVFHCDIQHCKQTYCRDEYYNVRYEHLLPKRPGSLE